jgi:hypothetical protein
MQNTASSSSSSSSNTNNNDVVVEEVKTTVDEIRAQAERVRLEAEFLEQRLTLDKIERLEQKLERKNWLIKHPEEEESIERQLQALQQKLIMVQNPGEENSIMNAPAIPNNNNNIKDTVAAPPSEKDASSNNEYETSTKTVAALSSPPPTSSASIEQPKQQHEANPLSGFDNDDLQAYLPVAKAVEARMPNNSTIDEMLAEFRAAPELQEYFQKKIKAMILQPMEDMQELEELRSQFLYTRSRVEKENLRRRIQQMEKELEKNGPFGYSDSIYANIPAMSDEEMEQRIQAVSALPRVLQGLYTLRTKAPEGDIRLAIQLDHYEAQLQLLEQISFLKPWTTELRDEATLALESLPMCVRAHFAQTMGLEECSDSEEILNHIIGRTSDKESEKEWSNMQELVVSSGASNDETDDLDYIDRSRYAEEFYPSIARMEGKHPSLDEVNEFISDVIDRRAFMVQSKPERVVGGWYIRGENLLSDDDDGIKLVKSLMERLEASTNLTEKLRFFYVPDPSPLSDEDFEMETPVQNLLYVTGYDPTVFYNNLNLLSKLSLSTIGIATIALFSLASVEMVPGLQDRFDLAFTNGNEDLEWLVDTATPVFGSLMGIYASHEVGHVIIALRDNFKIGFGTPIASIQTGFFGSITPLRSPPPSMKSLFDFAMAGPLFGFVTSLVLFVMGLQETATAQMNASMDFPALPTFLLRSSALCSGLVEFFLGKGTLFSGMDLPVEAVLPLHPFAVAGYVGLFVNALALLPIGSTYCWIESGHWSGGIYPNFFFCLFSHYTDTDGGRISLAMFGRRGTYLLSTFTSVVLCLVGLFGYDESRMFLTYTLFTLLWQRDMETPARNEVEELDLGQGALGILAALFVALTLVPFL